MTITQKDLDKMAELACLEPMPLESELARDVSQIMDFVEQLQATDTQGIAPLYRPFDLHQPMRADQITEADCLAELEKIAPEFSEGLYWLPKVLETGK